MGAKSWDRRSTHGGYHEIRPLFVGLPHLVGARRSLGQRDQTISVLVAEYEKHRDSILENLLGRNLSNGMPKLQALFRILSLNSEWPTDDQPITSRREFLV